VLPDRLASEQLLLLCELLRAGIPGRKDQWWCERLCRTFSATPWVAGQLVPLTGSVSQHLQGGSGGARAATLKQSNWRRVLQRSQCLRALNCCYAPKDQWWSERLSHVPHYAWWRANLCPSLVLRHSTLHGCQNPFHIDCTFLMRVLPIKETSEPYNEATHALERFRKEEPNTATVPALWKQLAQ